jgi:cytochrome c-type biogenesis protein CcmF
LLLVHTVCLTATGAVLLWALVRSDFRFEYVASYTERALPVGYKIAALWAGQAGSLLLWGWLIAVMCTIAAAGMRRLGHAERACAVGVMAVVCGFFAMLLLFAASPFELVAGGAPIDGRGLNPMLQDPAMIIHPPLLFAGYAGFTVPFAVLVGVLITRRRDDRWIAAVRRWLVFSWMILGAGILLGAWWAYVELGWGGYWAWDPVENASLLPWLTATAAMHSVIIQQHRGMFRRWSSALIAATFVLCIFGTWLTRSGVIDSVHAFAGGLLATFFLFFMLLAAALSIGLIAWRWRDLAPAQQLEGVVSREGAFLAANVLLVIMTLATLVGTIFPLLSAPFAGEPVTVKAPYYNKIVAPMGILLVGLMTLGPVLVFGRNAATRIGRNILVPGVFAAAVTAIIAVTTTRNPWALICIALVVLGTGNVIVDFARMVSARRRNTGEGLFAAALRVIDRDHRRYGGQLAHLGIMLIVVGVAGSSLFATEQTLRMAPGQSAESGRYTLTFERLGEVRAANYTAVEARVSLRGPDGESVALRPQRRFYNGWEEEPNSEVAILAGFREDVYVSLAGWEQGGAVVALQVRVNPLVGWIWLGGVVLTLGALLGLLPPFAASATRVRARREATRRREQTSAAISLEQTT